MSAIGFHLIARIAGERVAISAGEIGSVIEIDALVPVPLAPSTIAGLAARRSKVLTVIDPYAAFGLARPTGEGPLQAVTLECEGHAYALLVDEVEDVVAAGTLFPSIPGAMSAGWERVAIGLVEQAGAASRNSAGSRLSGGVNPALTAASLCASPQCRGRGARR